MYPMEVLAFMITRRGFLLGIVLMISILMAVFIFSFNSIVRQRNIQAHHLMISETASYLALSGLRMLSDRVELLMNRLYAQVARICLSRKPKNWVTPLILVVLTPYVKMSGWISRIFLTPWMN